MATGTEGSKPSYVSPRSADVILSDIRPIKLHVEALRCLNALLDEFLSSLITTAHSLSTDRLKMALLKVLPTTLGKEALLEAEMELRAYWERTNAARPGLASVAADAGTEEFNPQWAVELMRLKCEAYSTLNDADEDAQAEVRLSDKLGGVSANARKAVLVAPAALYLTAIMESVCEHILSNVGRVATRDSSRTTASSQDLFVALCEDDSMYTLFKTMKVYAQIESLTKPPKSRRSKSISRNNDRHETSSPLPDGPYNATSTSRARISSESSTSAANGAAPSRSSSEKVKGFQLFKAPNRSSIDRDMPHADLGSPRKADGSQDGPRKSSGGQSDSHISNSSFDDQDDLDTEFDDLMRSGDTRKVSLTPDRLRTMEDYKQERNQRSKRSVAENIAPYQKDSASLPLLDTPSRPVGGRRPSLRAVDSIVEDDEEPNGVPPLPADMRSRLNDNTRHSPQTPPPSSSRIRSLSTSHTPNASSIMRKVSLSGGNSSPPVSMRSKFDQRLVTKQDDTAGLPKRTRKIQRNRESLDLDAVMNGSDDEEENYAPLVEAKSTPKHKGVSSSTRELMDFLAEGPPTELQPQRLAAASSVSLTPTTKSSKTSGRLQRMISKLSLGGDKSDSPQRVRRITSAGAMSAPPTPSASLGSMMPLPPALKPVPPRIPSIPISPPSSPSRGSTPEVSIRDQDTDRTRTYSFARKAVPNWGPPEEVPVPTPPKDRFTPSPRPPPSPVPPSKHSPASSTLSVNGVVKPVAKREPVTALREEDNRPRSARSDKTVNGSSTVVENGAAKDAGVKTEPAVHKPPTYRPRPSRPGRPASGSSDAGSKRASMRKPAPTPELPDLASQPPSLSEEMALEMRRFLSKASTADECRLLVDMFMAKAGISTSALADRDNASTPPLTDASSESSPSSNSTAPTLESSLVEMFLGGEIDVSLFSSDIDGLSALAPVSPPYTPKLDDGEDITKPRDIPPALSVETRGDALVS